MAEVTIRGAGAFGLAIGYACAARGASVRMIDPRGPGGGASGGIVGALAPHTPERWNAKKAFQFESLIAARSFWAQVEACGGISSGYGALGRLQPILNARGEGLARSRGVEAEALWQGKATWEVIATEAISGPWQPPSPSGLLIHDTLSARLHPRRACDALAAAIRALGGEIMTEGEEQGAVIHATGYEGLRALSKQLGAPMGDGQKGQAILLGFDAGMGAPQLFADTVHFIPHSDGTLAIGSTSERDFDSPDQTDGALDALYARALAVMPILADAPVLKRWAGVRPRSHNRAPMLGAWPGRPGHFIANGGFKIGFGMAPGVARVMADLVLDGRDTIPDDFRIEVPDVC
ncbi:MAG: NAD(P)/FAD-dependent oxidoreductase [Paracoccaceae bacterium]